MVNRVVRCNFGFAPASSRARESLGLARIVQNVLDGPELLRKPEHSSEQTEFRPAATKQVPGGVVQSWLRERAGRSNGKGSIAHCVVSRRQLGLESMFPLPPFKDPGVVSRPFPQSDYDRILAATHRVDRLRSALVVIVKRWFKENISIAHRKVDARRGNLPRRFYQSRCH
ncbi:uncharacterized protein PADG_12132 [Paracoccidioides brasiliensis Pb18]|uniref:Uncharacterized protein n=1 Tax=Paracoccidioides brasiliensis (strain Pb18) TaxID=502780 RepID=A0A0A0HWP6_PARBD|nr:uncharacterized protein PADG_12132 [Paracoccidioides brasiliensis Pb18]KGM91815.1 hypothetical protein PADG_12132 [Paracoccidioides brasiliensis Pb18]